MVSHLSRNHRIHRYYPNNLIWHRRNFLLVYKSDPNTEIRPWRTESWIEQSKVNKVSIQTVSNTMQSISKLRIAHEATVKFFQRNCEYLL